MFAKLVVAAHDRAGAPAHAAGLDEFHVEGVPTTIPAHRWVLESKEFKTGKHTTTWAERALAEAEFQAQVELRPSGPTARGRPADILVEVDGRRVGVRVFDERRGVAPSRRRLTPERTTSTCTARWAEMQGTIVKVLVEKGQDIRAGEVICILEAMKMENHIAASRDGGHRAADPSRPGRGDRSGARRDRLTGHHELRNRDTASR